VKFANFVYIVFALRAGKITIFEPKAVSGYFTARNTYIQNLQTSQGYIFFILQHLATNRCSFTHSKTLFLAVVLDFAHFLNNHKGQYLTL
jgi:phosphorylcholine metabolism protein LicD